MVDETRDISNREQLVIRLRWTDEFQTPHEGLYQIDRADASTIAAVVKDVLIRLQMPLDKCRGQCYDGCSTMSGHKNGVAAISKKDEPRAFFTHCYGHALNLAASDAVMQCGHMKDSLDTVYEITKLVNFSPKREAQLRNNKTYFGNDCDEKDAPNIRIICPTRWTVRAQALRSIMENYKLLLTLWEEVLDDCRDSDIKAHTIGVLVLGHTDSLSEAIQKKTLTASEAQRIAAMTVKTLSLLRNEAMWTMFWEKLKCQADGTHVSSPTLPRRRRAPLRLEDCIGGKAMPEYPETVDDHYRTIYFEALDLVTTAINDRFNQPDYGVYAECEELLLSAMNGNNTEAIVVKVVEFFKHDFSVESLRLNLQTLAANYKGEKHNFSDILEYFRSLGPGVELMREALKLVKLLLIIPVTNATSERSFSTLRRVKSYLRSSMKQSV
ncbi:hypothetical protein EMCRGX_G000382 [Ephydatia muelleri]